MLIVPRAKSAGAWQPIAPLVTAVVGAAESAVRFQLDLPFVPQTKFWISAYPLRQDAVRGSFEVGVPKGGALQFAIGVLEGWQRIGPVEFTVEVCVSERCEVVFHEVVEAAAKGKELSGWLDRRVSLAAYAGQEVSLRFVAKAADEGKLVPVAFFGDPILVEAGKSDDQGPNLLLISIDTLRADHVSSYGYDIVISRSFNHTGAEESPHLSLARCLH